MTDREQLTPWDALKRAWPVLIDRMTKRVDMKWESGEISVYWAGDVLRVDIKFNKTPEKIKEQADDDFFDEEYR